MYKRLGIPGAGMLFLSQKSYYSSNFPKYIMHDFEPTTNYLSHAKIIVHHQVNNDKYYAYIGSHNFSAAAFGKLQKNETQIHISNYELGVMFKPRKFEKSECTSGNIPKIFPLPFKMPLKKYKENDMPFIPEAVFD
jgi:tyrosyl-DNA phosphodiesterase-1